MHPLFRKLPELANRWLDRGSANAAPAHAIVIRRARGFGLVAYAMQLTGVVLGFSLGQLRVAAIAGAAMLATAACLRWVAKHEGRYARLACHTALGFMLTAVTAVAVLAGNAPPMSALYPIPLIMAANFVLGVRSAAIWTVASIAALAYVSFQATPPAHVTVDADTWRSAVFWSRGIILAIVFVLGAVARRFEDDQTRQLEFMARHDSLTGLANRSEFDFRLGLAIARARRHEWSVALLFIDLDGFKQINDTLGHVSGDAVLRAVGEQIRAATRKTDVAGRIGGDEFVVLLEAAGDEDKSAELYGKRLLERIEGCAVHVNALLRVNASIGISHFPRDARDGDELMRRADAAMYEAKRAGGSRVVLTGADPTR